MKTLVLTCAFCLTVAFPASGTNSRSLDNAYPLAKAQELKGLDPIGTPGKSDEITRTIEFSIKETESGKMLFEPDVVHVEKGSVVRFVIINVGALEHEFVLGSFDEIGAHQERMHQHPDGNHEGSNAVAIPKGETAELIWKFSEKANLEFVCLLPGHREAGMWGVILVHDELTRRSKK